jgi:hypothetical protein
MEAAPISTQLANSTRPDRSLDMSDDATSASIDDRRHTGAPRGMSPTPDSGDTCPVGFNPHRQHRRSPLDYVMVAAALATCVGLVIWALFG